MKRPRASKLLLIVLVLILGAAAQAQEDGLPVKHLPREGQTLVDFLPDGWMVEEEVSGDLNGDGGADIAAILIQDQPDFDASGLKSERQRGLVVLIGYENSGFHLAGTNDSLLHCTTCGGVKEGVGLDIKKGILVLSQLSGSRLYTETTWRFRYDHQTQRFILIGRDAENADGTLGTGKVESCNCLTGLKLTETYRHDRDGKRRITLSTTRGQCPKKTPFVEDVTG
jgi:hypothetical protein